MFRRQMFLGLVVLGAVAACSPTSEVAVPDGTKLVILRHADRDEGQLNAKGRARAEALVPALDGIALDAIYAPDIQRNIDTAEPLAAARGLEINLINRFDAAEGFLRVVAAANDETIVWVGNKDNLTPIWEALGLAQPAPLEYGDLFIVDKTGTGAPVVTRLRYGAE